MNSRRWLLLMDLDGTVWDHKDISKLDPPFRRIRDNVISDTKGIIVRLNPEIINLLKWARGMGAIISTLSWNIPEKAMSALKTFNILNLFDYFIIENTHRKDKMIRKLLSKIRIEMGIEFRICEIVYIDDHDIHIEDIYRNIGQINFLQYNVNFKSYNEAIKLILDILSDCWGVRYGALASSV